MQSSEQWPSPSAAEMHAAHTRTDQAPLSSNAASQMQSHSLFVELECGVLYSHFTGRKIKVQFRSPAREGRGYVNLVD